MGTKTIGKVVFGVISVTLAFFTLSLGIFHYMQPVGGINLVHT